MQGKKLGPAVSVDDAAVSECMTMMPAVGAENSELAAEAVAGAHAGVGVAQRVGGVNSMTVRGASAGVWRAAGAKY